MIIGRTVIRAVESLDQVKLKSEVELRFPERIYANHLRNTATIPQVLLQVFFFSFEMLFISSPPDSDKRCILKFNYFKEKCLISV